MNAVILSFVHIVVVFVYIVVFVIIDIIYDVSCFYSLILIQSGDIETNPGPRAARHRQCFMQIFVVFMQI